MTMSKMQSEKTPSAFMRIMQTFKRSPDMWPMLGILAITSGWLVFHVHRALKKQLRTIGAEANRNDMYEMKDCFRLMTHYLDPNQNRYPDARPDMSVFWQANRDRFPILAGHFDKVGPQRSEPVPKVGYMRKDMMHGRVTQNIIPFTEEFLEPPNWKSFIVPSLYYHSDSTAPESPHYKHEETEETEDVD